MPIYSQDFQSSYIVQCRKADFGQTNLAIPWEFLELFELKTGWIILLLDLKDPLVYENSWLKNILYN